MPGTLADPDNVIVDVGTGFYVEKVCGMICVDELIIDGVLDHEGCYEVLRGKGRGAGCQFEGLGGYSAGEVEESVGC